MHERVNLMTPPLRVGSRNVSSMYAQGKQQLVDHMTRFHGLHVLGVQETRFPVGDGDWLASLDPAMTSRYRYHHVGGHMRYHNAPIPTSHSLPVSLEVHPRRTPPKKAGGHGSFCQR